MKQCPTCQRTYPDDSQNICPYDGTPVVFAAQQQQPYYTGGQQPPYYGAQGNPPPQQFGWTPPSPQGYGYPPQGYPPKSKRGTTLSRAALITGIGAIASLIWAAVLGGAFGSVAADLIFSSLALLAALAAIILSIITLVNAGKDTAINKAHGVLGLCFGSLILLIWFFSLINR